MLPSLSLWVCLFPCLSLSAAFLSLLSVSPCLPMCLLPLLSLCFSLQLPTSKPASISPVCFSLSHCLFPTSVWVSSVCLRLRESPSPPPVHPGSPPQPRAWGSSLSGPARSSAGPFVHCPTLQALLSLPPSQAPKLGRALQPKMWKNVVLSLGLRHQEAQDGCQSWTTPTQPLGPLGRQPPPPLSPSPSP